MSESPEVIVIGGGQRMASWLTKGPQAVDMGPFDPARLASQGRPH